jgi:hypothetical protein
MNPSIAPINLAQFMVSNAKNISDNLLIKLNYGGERCTGILINNNTIMTADHCTHPHFDPQISRPNYILDISNNQVFQVPQNNGDYLRLGHDRGNTHLDGTLIRTPAITDQTKLNLLNNLFILDNPEDLDISQNFIVWGATINRYIELTRITGQYDLDLREYRRNTPIPGILRSFNSFSILSNSLFDTITFLSSITYF